MVAFELSAKKWKLAFHDGRRTRARIATVPAWEFGSVMLEIERARAAMGLPTGTPVCSCYEAGREGFSVHRRLVQLGVDNVVIDAASVEVNRRARRAKTDRLDAEMLVAKLIAHKRGERAFAVVRIPSVEDESRRHEQRQLDDLKQERGRHTVRIKALLLTQGIAIKRWSADEDLSALRTIDERELPPELVQRIRDELARHQLVQEQIARIESSRKVQLAVPESERQPHVDRVKRLSTLKGIGTTGAFRMVLECFAWRKFSNRREVAGCLGLAPSPFASGSINREQGISKLGNAELRSLFIELSWLWLRYQPDSKIARWFAEKFAPAGRHRRIGIVAVARKLAIALWKYVEFGVEPEGTLMKT